MNARSQLFGTVLASAMVAIASSTVVAALIVDNAPRKNVVQTMSMPAFSSTPIDVTHTRFCEQFTGACKVVQVPAPPVDTTTTTSEPLGPPVDMEPDGLTPAKLDQMNRKLNP